MKKIKLISAMILLVVGTIACSKKGTEPSVECNGKQQFAIRLAQGEATRSIGGSVAKDSLAPINQLTLYFYNKQTRVILDRRSFTGDALNPFFTAEGQLISPIDGRINALSVIANDKGQFLEVNNPVTMIEQNELAVESQQIFDEITLFGRSENFILQENTGQGIDIYNVSVTLAPKVARIEVGNISCLDFTVVGGGVSSGIIYSELPLNSILIDKFYNSIKVTSITPTGAITQRSKSFIDNIIAGSALSDWSIDVLNSAQNITHIPYNPNTNNVFAYQFIPGGELPYIRLHFKGIKNKEGIGLTEDRYVTVKGYRDNGTGLLITEFDPGYVYKMDLAFSEEHINKFEEDQIGVIVNVIRHKWSEKIILPDFN